MPTLELLATLIQLSAYHVFLSGCFLSRLLFSVLGDKLETFMETFGGLGFKGETEMDCHLGLRGLLESLLVP